MNKKRRRVKLTPVSVTHYIKLIYRSALFLAAAVVYIISHIKHQDGIMDLLQQLPIIAPILWCVFVVEMILRFFPSKLESPGSQKQFARNYIKSGATEIKVQENNATMLVLLVWILFNGIFGLLHMWGILDDGAMLLLACAYSVCDMICILFFCPFQTWFLKNKCCSTCRIYNWDYAMMFTPLFFVRNLYGISLLLLSVALLIRWEVSFYRHPEWFSEETNEYLRCANCTEKLCSHKKQLQSLWRAVEEFTQERVRRLQK